MEPTKRADLERIFAAGIRAADPTSLVDRWMSAVPGGVEIRTPSGGPLRLSGRVGVYGAGKAAVAMASGVEAIGGSALALEGVVVAPYGTGAESLSLIDVLRGDHPVPGSGSLSAARELVARLRASPAEHFLFLISGGASSLLAEPLGSITIRHKQQVTELLLGCGAAIEEINIVRKHISSIKGGRLLRHTAPHPVVTLILSDVVGDDPSTVGSGPSVADESSYGDAIAVLERHRLMGEIPEAVREVLRRGERGEIAETVRASSPEGSSSRPIVVGSNALALAGAAAEARRLGYEVRHDTEPLVGETVDCAVRWLDAIEKASPGAAKAESVSRRRAICWLAGGETTVTLRGSGLGGRNQEFGLALVRRLSGGGLSVLSAGSDGIDGPTDAAGALIDGSTLSRAARIGLAPEPFLQENDSYRFFEKLGDLFQCGATGTNVMDIKIALQ